MSNKFKVEGIGCSGKEIEITGPFELRLTIDYDDVDHPRVEREARKLARLLNAHWKTFGKKPKLQKTDLSEADALRGAGTHPVPQNAIGIFAMHCNDNEPLPTEDQQRILDGPISAAEAKLREEIAKPLDLSGNDTH